MDPAQLAPVAPDLPVALTTITAQLHLLQRRLLRADGLSNLERDLRLGTVAAVLTSVRDLSDQVATLQRLSEQPVLEPPQRCSCIAEQGTSEFHSPTQLMLVLLILPVRLTAAADQIRQRSLLEPTDDHCAPTWESFATT